MQLTKDHIIAIQTTLIEAGFINQGVTPSGEWTSETQAGFNSYVRTHEEVLAEQMYGVQPGKMEQLGASLGHAIDHGITLAEAQAKKLKHWFVAKKDQAVIDAEAAAAAAKTKAEKAEADAKAEAARVAQAAKDAAAAAEVEAKRVKDAADAEAARAAKAASDVAEAAKDNAPAPKVATPVAPAPAAAAAAAAAAPAPAAPAADSK